MDKAALHIGAVAFIHRFGSNLNAHVHFHVCVVDGVFEVVPGEADADADAQATAPSVIFHPASGVDENVVGAMRSLGASNCALAENASQPVPRRIRLLKETHSLFVQSRAFKQELVDPKIDAREASKAIEEIDAEMKKCDARMARLAGS